MLKLDRTLALLALLSLLAVPAARAQNTPAKIATANPSRVLNDVQEMKDIRSKFEQEKNTIEGQIQARQMKLRDLKGALDALRSDAPNYEQQSREYFQALIEADAFAKISTAEFDQRYKMALKTLFDKVINTIQEVATRKGVDMVITDQRPSINEQALRQLNPDQLVAAMSQRNVLFSTPALDLTSEVITEMDARYKSGK